MRVLYTWLIATILFVGLAFSGQAHGQMGSHPESVTDLSLDRSKNFALQDAMTGNQESFGHTNPPAYQALEIHASDDNSYDYMAHSPYYKVYFKGNTARMKVKDSWIEFEVTQLSGKGLKLERKQGITPNVNQNSFSVVELFDSVDLTYKAETSFLIESLTIKENQQFQSIAQNISWGGMTPEFKEDGSILFSNENGKEILEILPPFMKDALGDVCTGVSYCLIETESGYELHKVLNEEGLKWLQNAVYPVVIDPTIEVIEDWWISSGITPYGQYVVSYPTSTVSGAVPITFPYGSQSITGQFVNPANGHQLTLTETDLVIPGRGLDVVISRVYETPAVFYGSNPYDYEAPPTDVGKGWHLNFPYVGSKYLHLWGGTIYKISWSGSTFENHKGTHFVLVKNGDDTYTLTTANGTVYEFNTSGKLTYIKDVDLNTITFTYTSGVLTSITDTIGRTISLSYSSNRLWKITYNSSEIEYSYDENGCLVWMDDFLNRRTSYEYDTGYNNWLLSEVEYPTDGYTTFVYNRFTDGDYYKYYVSDERVYETNQVRHYVYSYTGSFDGITSSTITAKNQSDVTQGSYYCPVTDGLVTQRQVKNASDTVICKYTYTYSSKNEIIQESVYSDGSTLSYTTYYAYDSWGNCIYVKNAEGHESYFSYANTDTSGFFMDKDGTIIKTFTDAFANSDVPSSVHTALLGMAEKQDATYVKEMYVTYDSEAHPTQYKNSFGNTTTWLTFSGTFNEKTGSTSFPINLTGYTVAGNGVLQITGLASDDTYQESKYTSCPGSGCRTCAWLSSGSGWSNNNYVVHWYCFIAPGEEDEGYQPIGPFTHYPGTFGYQSYSTNPALGQSSTTFTVTTNWKAYPVQVQYKMNSESYHTLSSNLKNTTVKHTATGFIDNSSNTLYFTESSAYNTKFSWYLYVPVNNSPDTYTTSLAYDSYGNVTSITDAESTTTSLTYSATYSYAYLTEISSTVGQDTITTKMTYDSNRGWITSTQLPKGVDAGSGYDYLYTYDVLGRPTKKEFPLLSGQGQRSYVELVYDDTNRTVTIIDPLRHYIVQQFDKLGRLTDIKLYTGTYGSGSLYATKSYAYHYNDLLSTITDLGNDQYTYSYDFLCRLTQVTYPGSVSVSYTYDDTNNKVTFTDGRGYDVISWYDWLSRLEKVEEEYATDTFAETTCQYDEVGHLTSVTDAENHTTSYTYASFFGLTRITYPDSEYAEYAYDSVGNVTTFTDCKGNDVTLSYDDIYRLTQIEYEDESTVDYTYDLNSNRTRMDDDVPSANDYVEYTYDSWNRLTSEKRHISASTYETLYEYDVANRLTAMTYPDDMEILYSYDDLNRMTEIKRYVDGSNDEVLMDNFQYDTECLLTQFDYGNDLQATFTYDSRDRISTLDVKNGQTSFLDLDYTYDNNSNITQLVNGWRDTSSSWHSETESYSYDGLDRLTSASCTSWSHTYSYDKVGNRTAKDSVTYTINTVNEVTALSDGTSFTYDDNGNRTQKTKGDDTWDYTYDYANRLTEVEENSTTTGEYVYDGDGKRIQTTENSTTTSMYSGHNVVYEETSTGTACYIYGPIGRLAKRTTISQESSTFYYHTDHLGSTRLVTDSSKDIVSAAAYHPFGEPSTEEGSEDYLFTGKEQDTTGLYYYGARYYDPDVGRFLTRDPLSGRISSPQSLNRYTYCQNNPQKFVDPWGLLEDNFSREGGGECEQPEVTGDPEYENGKITVPTNKGDVIIDPDKDEDWGDVDRKATEQYTQKEIRELNDKLNIGREIYKMYEKSNEEHGQASGSAGVGSQKCRTVYIKFYSPTDGCYFYGTFYQEYKEGVGWTVIGVDHEGTGKSGEATFPGALELIDIGGGYYEAVEYYDCPKQEITLPPKETRIGG
jgi:RHS repeat-associated protein